MELKSRGEFKSYNEYLEYIKCLKKVYPSMNCMYLRKSRVDIVAEMSGEGDTLKRHEQTLLKLTKKMGLPIQKIYREIVSGETIENRPVMKELLKDVENNLWDNVIVMEIERLARGDTRDQGLVIQCFKYSNTKIITPLKTYEPNNDSDEEYFEFGLFMSRREYKTITRRLNRGREMSVLEGKWVGNKAPYGYKIVKLENEKGYSLEIIEEEAKVVRLIFELRKNRNSICGIANELNVRGYLPRYAKKWTQETISPMLKNPTYIGMIRWGGRKQTKSMKNGNIIITRPVNKDKDSMIISKGLHLPIVDVDTYNAVQELNKTNIPMIPINQELKNPLAGILYCGKCGNIMTRRPYTDRNIETQMICKNTECDNVGAKLRLIEEQLIIALKEWLGNQTLNIDECDLKDLSLITKSEERIKEFTLNLEKERLKLEKVCEFYEDGSYSKEMFMERTKKVSDKIVNIEKRIKDEQRVIEEQKKEQENSETYLPRVYNVIDLYNSQSLTINDKNDLLKSILSRVVYTKDVKSAKKEPNATNFTLELYPKIG